MMRHTAFLFLLLLLSACSHIADDERLVYVKPAPVSRQVLIEDFTGQRCNNCPKASAEIASLQAQYGDEVVVAVGIHSGPLAFKTNARYVGLKTDTGDEYYDHWNIESLPIGMVDRQGLSDYTSWSAKVHTELQQTAPVSIMGDASLSDSTIAIHTTLMGIEGDVSGQLQLWLTEDSITTFQLMPDGTRDDNYLHRHVFRAAVNGIWGEAVSVKEGEAQTFSHSIVPDKTWQTSHMAVVAFVYNETGVLQVKTIKLKEQ